jgi:hypothetical protein
MSERILSETMLGLPAAARRLPCFRSDRPVSPSTVWRWIKDGVRLANGRIIRLEAIRLGARWVTSAEALGRFVAAQTPDFEGAPTPAQPRTAGRRQRAADRAGAELARLGI